MKGGNSMVEKRTQNLITAIVVAVALIVFSVLGADLLGALSVEITDLWTQMFQLAFWVGVIIIGVAMGSIFMKKDMDCKVRLAAIGVFGVIASLAVPELYDYMAWTMTDLLANTLVGAFWIGLGAMIISLAMFLVKAKNK